jgi:uncharacterized protein (DUF2267 family)
MDTDRFLTLVERSAGIDRNSAERTTAAVLTVLAEHLSRGEAAAVLEKLPNELRPYLYTTGPSRRLGVTEFVCRVARLEGSDPDTAEGHAGAVFFVLRQAIGDEEFRDLVAQLPREYGPLLSGRSVPDPADRLIARVAQLTDTSVADAERLTDAVLETLAQRIAPGDVLDLATRLPVRMHPALHHGVRVPDPQMSAGRFVAGVAERAGVDVASAVRRIPPCSRCCARTSARSSSTSRCSCPRTTGLLDARWAAQLSSGGEP